MSTPRKRKRGEEEGEVMEEGQEKVTAAGTTQFSPSPSKPSHGLSPDSPLIIPTAKRRHLTEHELKNNEAIHQYAPGAPNGSASPSVTKGTPSKTKVANSRTAGPGFITSSPMNKRTSLAGTPSKRSVVVSKAVRRLSDDFNSSEATALTIPLQSLANPIKPTTIREKNAKTSEEKDGMGSKSNQGEEEAEEAEESSSGSSRTFPKLSFDSNGNTSSKPWKEETVVSLRHSHSDLRPPVEETRVVDVRQSHGDLRKSHHDSSDEMNTSLMDTIFSPGLRNYVSQKLHELTSSFGTTHKSSETDVDGSQGHHINNNNHNHNHSHHENNNCNHHEQEVPNLAVQKANGIHHAAYRRRPTPSSHHGLSTPLDGSLGYEVKHEGKHNHGVKHNHDGHDHEERQHVIEDCLIEHDEEGPILPVSPGHIVATHMKHLNESEVSSHKGELKDTMIPSREESVDEEIEEELQAAAEGKSLEITPTREEVTMSDVNVANMNEKELGDEVAVTPRVMELAKQDDDDELVKDDVDEVSEEEFDSYFFMATVPPLSSLPKTQVVPPGLPIKARNTPKVTLVLDLDETLVHCSLEKIDNPDLIFIVPFEGEEYEVYVRKRPGFEEFLERVSKIFEVAVFTASQQAYADKLLSILDPSRKWIHHRLFRDSCIYVLGNYLKDLNVLGRELSKVIIVDNSPHVFAYQLDNGVPIESWFNDHRDRELLHLLPFLETLAKTSDVRPHIRQKFQLFKRVEESKRAYNRIAKLNHLEPLESAYPEPETDDEQQSQTESKTNSPPRRKSARSKVTRRRPSVATQSVTVEEAETQNEVGVTSPVGTKGSSKNASPAKNNTASGRSNTASSGKINTGSGRISASTRSNNSSRSQNSSVDEADESASMTSPNGKKQRLPSKRRARTRSRLPALSEEDSDVNT